MRNFYITADTHFGHQMLIDRKYRPIDFMEKIIKGLKNIKADDVLIHLGDFCIGNDDKWHRLFRRLVPCKMILVTGNHDKKSNNWYLDRGWDFVCRKFEDKYFGQKIIFTHIPLRYVKKNYVNIHGHLHDMKNPHHKIWALNKHILIALEETNYQLTSLKALISNFNNHGQNK